MSMIECGICLLQYDEEDLTPRILTSCGHTICQQCAIKLSDAYSQIICPFDRKVTQLNRDEGVNGLQKNFALLDLCREEKREQEKNSGVEADVPCFENPSHEAVLYCEQCEVELCDSCFTSVHKPKSLSAHQKIKISEKLIKLPKCPEHPHNIAELLCTDPNCEIPTKIMCQTCVLFDQHKSHKHDFLMEKLLENEQLLKNLLGRSEKLRREKKRCLFVNGRQLKSCEVTGEIFKSAFQSISDQFDMKKKEALRKMTQFANDMEDENNRMNIRLNEECSELMKLQELIEKKLKMKTDLHNTDEVKIWETKYKSSSKDIPVGFLDYEFILPEMNLQINRKQMLKAYQTKLKPVNVTFQLSEDYESSCNKN